MAGLELLAPAYLALLGLLVPLIVFYILKVKRQRRRIASTWLWREARRDLMARSPFRRLVVQLPLILQALALIALAVAASRPATRGKTFDGDHVAIIVDTSASMGAQDPQAGKARIELAKDTAHDIIASLPPGSDALILDAGHDTRVSLPPDRDTRRMHDAIDKFTAREVEGDLASALSLAVGRLSQLGGKGRVFVLTDGNLASDLPPISAQVPVEIVRLGAPVDNAGIVRVDVRSGLDPVLDKEQVQAFLLVANFGERERELHVTMRQHNASDTLASRKVVVKPGDKVPVVLSFYPAEGDYRTGLIFDLAPHDALPADDVAYGRVPEGRKLPVYFAAAGGEHSSWLLRALVSDDRAEVRAGTVDELMARRDIPHDAFVVVEGACPADAPGADLLIVDPPGGHCFGTLVGSTVEKPIITSWESADPRLRFLTFDGVFVAEARLLDPEGKRQELIRSDQGVIAADVSSTARTATLLAFDVGQSNWPLKASFVLFVRNLMELAREHRQSGVSGPARAGAPLRVSVPAGVEQVEVAPPAGEPKELLAREGLVVIPEVERTGLYRVSWEKPQGASIFLPVNLASAAESDLSETLDGDKLATSVSMNEADEAVEAHHDWGWILALVALAFIVFDVWYYTRQPRRRTVPARPEEAAA